MWCILSFLFGVVTTGILITVSPYLLAVKLKLQGKILLRNEKLLIENAEIMKRITDLTNKVNELCQEPTKD